jgi:hypothetical protein
VRRVVADNAAAILLFRPGSIFLKRRCTKALQGGSGRDRPRLSRRLRKAQRRRRRRTPAGAMIHLEGAHVAVWIRRRRTPAGAMIHLQCELPYPAPARTWLSPLLNLISYTCRPLIRRQGRDLLFTSGSPSGSGNGPSENRIHIETIRNYPRPVYSRTMRGRLKKARCQFWKCRIFTHARGRLLETELESW